MNDFQHAMLEVTRLTQAGRLAEATALIQHTLGSKKTNEPSSMPTSHAEAPIDAEFSILDDTASPEKTPPQETPNISAPRPVSEQRGGAPGKWSHHVRQQFGRRSTLSPGRAPTWTTASGQWVEKTYSNSHGSRPNKLYMPGGYTG